MTNTELDPVGIIEADLRHLRQARDYLTRYGAHGATTPVSLATNRAATDRVLEFRAAVSHA